ncbi:hypothetical protein ACQP04_21300 [Pseudonocardia halophobica]|uniref:hypothetical protein n=1 Tax=Pseudonocardia halophobica TaxID=29401 RepID=UPI003D8E842E
MLRLADPTAGEIRFDGADITRVKGRGWRELRRRAQLGDYYTRELLGAIAGRRHATEAA